MEEWDYKELKEYVSEVFTNSINDGLDALQSGGRCLYEFANVIEEGETEKAIFYISLAHLQIEKGILSQRIFDEVKSITKDFNIDKFISELGLEDAQDLSELLRIVEAKFHGVEVVN
ncbi:Imm3 family immunity protein [Metabacillus fastidiosus]|uniref:Imm3 family immunity protein n=1 Tax=Metabacillus fastidiosus TaxID=1458 RepID=UPI0008250E0A|nr:Imm3 family immunity protein [Metabacillus fastidiosus]MED4461277.1 Imm3 family immunity protein [Metabacillus fastidiosus]